MPRFYRLIASQKLGLPPARKSPQKAPLLPNCPRHVTVLLWLNTRVPSSADSSFNQLLRDLNTFLRMQGFRRSGQRYGRETEQCWQIIGLQKSRYSDTDEVRFTVNFGVTSKALMEFRDQDVAKMPLDWTCPIRWRIGELRERGDHWWSSNDGDHFRSALTAITARLSETDLPFLNALGTDREILALYDTGLVMGFEIDRDETRAVLAAHLGLSHEAFDRSKGYEAMWLPGAASKRAEMFLASFRARFGTSVG
jgi:hypothetical protein